MSVTVSQLAQKIVIEGDTEAKAKLSGMHEAAEKTSGGFKSMLGSALSFAAGQAIFNVAAQGVSFLKDQLGGCLQESMDAAAGMAQTEEVIKSTGDASGMSAQQIVDMAGSLSHLTTFSDDAIQSGENLLLTFTGIGKDVFPMATKTMLDMSQAMGQDVKSTAIQMGKALNDPAQGLTALTRVGVTFTDEQKNMIKSMVAAGDVAGAQKIMLKELQREFGGSAEAAGKTFGGQMIILKQRLSDVKQQIGDALMPVLQNMMGWVSSAGMPLLEKFGDWFTKVGVPAFQHFGDMVGKVWGILDDEGLGILIASFQNLANAIGQDLAPVLGPIGNTIKSIFSDSSVISGAHNLEGAFYNIAANIDVVSTGIKQLTGFFQSNSIQAQIVKDLMIGIGVAIAAIGIGAFVLALPALVAGFIAWAVAAGAAAIATIAATWPILAIGALIAIVVAGIILAVQHWGDISKWLQGVWSAFSAWFMGLMGGIGAWFTGLWNGIANFFVGLWNGIMGGVHAALSGIASFFTGVWNGIISFLQAAWGVIVNIIKIGALLALAVIFAPIIAIAALFIWLYNHNYYFKALVDNIVNFFKGCFTWAVGAWQGFVSWLVGLWNGVVGFATTAWNAVTNAVTIAVNATGNALRIAWQASINFIVGLWNGAVGLASAAWGAVSRAVMSVINPIVAWVKSTWDNAVRGVQVVWNLLSGYATAAWNAVVGVFQGVWGKISSALSSLWNNISTWAGNLAGQFLTWGGNVIAQFIQGIEDKIGQIGTTLAKAADTVKNFLGFHSPTKEGPGREADQWAPNFVNMYAKGLEAGIPKIEGVVSRLMRPISMSLTPGAMSGGVSLPQSYQSPQSSQGDIYLQIDGRTFARLTMPYTVNEIRNTVGIRI